MSRVAKAFGRKLRQLRVARGLSQEQVAELAGLSTNAVGSFERGVRFPRDSSLDSLLDALSVEPDALAQVALTARDGVAVYLSSLPIERPLRDVLELLADQPDEVVILVKDITQLVISTKTKNRS